MRDSIIEELKHYRNQMAEEVNLNSISKMAPVAYKWTCLYKCWNIRELVMYRLLDLLEGAESNQIKYSHVVSAILTRSAIETISILVRLNTLTEKVVSEELDFFDFENEIDSLIFGSRNEDTPFTSKNTLTLIKKADRKYEGLFVSFEKLCEKAHPNFAGLMNAYSKHHAKGTYTLFESQYSESYTDFELTHRIIDIFQKEYNDIWPQNYNALIKWLEDNDTALEEKREKAMKGKEQKKA